MPCSRRKSVRARFCRYGCTSIWLVAMASAPRISIACLVSAMVKLEMPIARVRPCCLACASASRYCALGPGPWRRPMDQGEIDILGGEFAQAFPQARQQGAVAELVHPDLGGQIQLIARDAGGCDRFANLRFVVVNLRGIDRAIAQLQCAAHRVDDNLMLETKGTEAECGDSHCVPLGTENGESGMGSVESQQRPCATWCEVDQSRATTALPKFLPRNTSISPCGALSRPRSTCSRY